MPSIWHHHQDDDSTHTVVPNIICICICDHMPTSYWQWNATYFFLTTPKFNVRTPHHVQYSSNTWVTSHVAPTAMMMTRMTTTTTKLALAPADYSYYQVIVTQVFVLPPSYYHSSMIPFIVIWKWIASFPVHHQNVNARKRFDLFSNTLMGMATLH